MAFIPIQLDPTPRQLRQFGAAWLVVLPLLGWLWGGRWESVAALAAAGGGLALVGMVRPAALKLLFLVCTLVAAPIGFVLGELVMLLIYFGVFLPFALAFRLLGRDALQRKADPAAITYWQPKKQPADLESYFRQS